MGAYATEEFLNVKESRRENGESRANDQTVDRLAVRLKCQEVRFRKLVRKLEDSCL